MDYITLLRKYADNTASHEEINLLMKWLEDPENEKIFEAFLRDEWDQYIIDEGTHVPKLEKILDSINLNINVNEEPKTTSNTNTSSHFIGWRLATGFAAVIALACFSWTYLALQNLEVPADQALVMEVKSNPKGQKSTLILRDGTHVKLNADSELSFPEVFEDDQRIVHLKGEAFFEVTRDVNRPFTVVTENISTTALGTSFNVKAFPNQKDIEIILATGKVNVANTESDSTDKIQSVILEPSYRATFSKVSKGLIKDSINMKEKLAWKDGVLLFHDASLIEMKEKLERWYNVEIVVRNPAKLGNRQFTGSFDNESLKNVMEGISFSSHFTYEIKGRKVFINF